MSTKPRPRKRHNAKGRTDYVPPFFQIQHHVYDSDAYHELSCVARSLLIALARRHNGFNNGRIGLGEIEAGRDLGVDRRTARKAFRELMDTGFVIQREKGAFSRKDRKASEWELTMYALPGEHTPKAWFRRWKPGTVFDPETGEAVSAPSKASTSEPAAQPKAA